MRLRGPRPQEAPTLADVGLTNKQRYRQLASVPSFSMNAPSQIARFVVAYLRSLV